MGCRPAGLEAAALIDRDVDDHRAGLHGAHELAADELGRRRAGDQNGADHEIGGDHLALDILHRREQGVELRPELQVELV